MKNEARKGPAPRRPGPAERCFGPTTVVFCLIGLVFFLVGVATRHWAEKTEGGHTVNTGLFQACLTRNNTCYDTATQFDAAQEKPQIIASAVLCAFATAGIIFTLFLDVMYLCGLFEEKAIATAAIIFAWLSVAVGCAGIALFGVSITSLEYNIAWSFFLAIVGVVFVLLSGIFMILAKLHSTKLKE